jgi:hypothetical protein
LRLSNVRVCVERYDERRLRGIPTPKKRIRPRSAADNRLVDRTAFAQFHKVPALYAIRTHSLSQRNQALCCAVCHRCRKTGRPTTWTGIPVRVRRGEKRKKAKLCLLFVCVCVCRDGPADVLRLLSAVDRNIYQLPTPVQRSSVLAPWHYNTPVDSALSSAHDVCSIFSPHTTGKNQKYEN